MTPAARFKEAIDILELLRKSPQPADGVLSRYFRTHRYIGAKDRQDIAARVYMILRAKARLEWWAAKLGLEVDYDRHLALIALVLCEGKDKAGVMSLCSGKAREPDALLLAEAKALERLKGHTLNHPNMPELVGLECPEWAAPGLKTALKQQFENVLTAMQGNAQLHLRVNSIHTTRDAVLAQFKKEKIEATAGALSPVAIHLAQRINLAAHELFTKGKIEIQDEGSQLVAYLVSAQPGERVMDFCAGAGGKTLAMAATMQNKGRLVACDVLEKRLTRAALRFRRAGVHNIETRPLGAINDPWLRRQKAKFDAVLVDAPCSGTGTWRRNPDARWKQLGPDLSELLKLQGEILANASGLVKVGGRLVYATCSLLEEENFGQIAAFLTSHPNFQLIDYQDIFRIQQLPLPVAGPCLLLNPAKHGTDGFFGAVLKRVE